MYPCAAVEHSYNCMVLLCSLFLWPSGHYTKIIKAPDYKNYKSVSLPFTAPNDGYICGGVYSLGTTACYIYVNSTQVGWNHSGGGSNTNLAGKQDSLKLPQDTPVDYSVSGDAKAGGWTTIDGNTAYFNLMLNWALIQFRMRHDGLWIRMHWGKNTPSDWKQLF